MNENFELMMWSSSNIDLQNVDVVVDHHKMIKNTPQFEPTPYTFTKLKNGKKTAADSASLTPPSWLLLDHSIAVIWSMFSATPQSYQLSIDDFKWAYEFLKEIKNKKGENPPDVKVCLKEIQDRLIDLYARLTSLKQRDFDEIAAAFGDKIIEGATASYYNTTFTTNKLESKLDSAVLSSPPRSPGSPETQRRSSKDTQKAGSRKISKKFSQKKFPVLEEDSDPCEGTETVDDEEVEKYLLRLFDDQKKEESLQAKPSTKSLIPTKKKNTQVVLSEVVSSQDPAADIPKKEKTSKRVHCVAEMRSLKFQKSMKVQDTNGEEAAYSNLKAEIKRLSFNPNVPRNEIMKFLKEWRSEQMDRLNNELQRLSSIEEFMKSLTKEEVEPNLQMNSHLRLKELDTAKSNYSLPKSLLP